MSEQRPGVWRLRVVKAYRPDGQPIQASRTIRGTKKQAQSALSKFVTEIEQGTADLSGKLTVRQYLDGRYMPHVRAHLQPDSIRNYALRCDRFSKDIGSIRLDKLTAAHLDFTYQQWRQEGLAPSTIKAYHAVIAAALSQAVRWGLLSRSVAPLATLPRAARRAPTVPTMDQIRTLVVATESTDPVLSAAIMLAALTGARRGELLGLRWSDIDRTHQVLTISRSVKRGENDRAPVVGPTKTHSTRRLSLDDATLEVFAMHRLRCEQWAKQGGLDLSDGYVLTDDPSGQTPMSPDKLTTAFGRAVRAAGVPTVRFHDLRHAVATALLSHGYDLSVVAGRLGHASPQITLRVYAHALEQKDRQAAGLMGALLAAQKAT